MINSTKLEPMLAKFRTRGHLNEADAAALLALPLSIKEFDAGQYILREGDKATSICVVLTGFSYRQKILGDGARQIIAIQVPGDVADLPSMLLKVADHSVRALTEVTAAIIPKGALQQALANHPSIARALWLESVVDCAIAWEWLSNVARRSARVRVAHLLCEWATRMEVVGLDHEQRIALPMTQEQIGDVLGLTQVHVNRSIRALVADGLILRPKPYLTILNRRGLRELADFSDGYLHLNLLED